jgi:RNAse (barnase) inhibitor barstar
MAVFHEPWNEHPLDWEILQNSPIALYFRQETLDQDIEWLRGNRYEVFVFDCSGWKSEAAFHRDVAGGLGFPDYYGRNLPAFYDCLSDLVIADDGGTAIVFQKYDQFTRRDPKIAWRILDIIADNSRIQSLFGRRLIALVQSDDPAIEFDPVGACPVMWNPKEWLNERRGL